MNKRQAKKILRNVYPYSYKHFRAPCYSDNQIRIAKKLIRRFQYRQALDNDYSTAGSRFGRWDPMKSFHPDGPPF